MVQRSFLIVPERKASCGFLFFTKLYFICKKSPNRKYDAASFGLRGQTQKRDEFQWSKKGFYDTLASEDMSLSQGEVTLPSSRRGRLRCPQHCHPLLWIVFDPHNHHLWNLTQPLSSLHNPLVSWMVNCRRRGKQREPPVMTWCGLESVLAVVRKALLENSVKQWSHLWQPLKWPWKKTF